MSGLHELEYADMEYEAEMFDPTPPPAGAVLLTRFAFASSALTAPLLKYCAMIPFRRPSLITRESAPSMFDLSDASQALSPATYRFT